MFNRKLIFNDSADTQISRRRRRRSPWSEREATEAAKKRQEQQVVFNNSSLSGPSARLCESRPLGTNAARIKHSGARTRQRLGRVSLVRCTRSVHTLCADKRGTHRQTVKQMLDAQSEQHLRLTDGLPDSGIDSSTGFEVPSMNP
ncbi:hypothetical protein MTO96_019017 [Rhipicephalus appendiculatus]